MIALTALWHFVAFKKIVTLGFSDFPLKKFLLHWSSLIVMIIISEPSSKKFRSRRHKKSFILDKKVTKNSYLNWSILCDLQHQTEYLLWSHKVSKNVFFNIPTIICQQCLGSQKLNFTYLYLNLPLHKKCLHQPFEKYYLLFILYCFTWVSYKDDW